MLRIFNVKSFGKSANSIDAGAEPSPAYFNILMYGEEEEEVLDGTQLAADWTFSGLQKFGQGMLDRLRGLRFRNKLLEKVPLYIPSIPRVYEHSISLLCRITGQYRRDTRHLGDTQTGTKIVSV